MDDKDYKNLREALLDDAAFATLIEEEMAARPAEKAELFQQRVWNRLQASLEANPASKKKNRFLITALSVAAVIFLISLGSPFLSSPPMPGEDPQPSYRSGSTLTYPVLKVLIEKSAGSILIRLMQQPDAAQNFALIADQRPLAVLWQGRGSAWVEPFQIPAADYSRICIIQGNDAAELRRKIGILTDLNELPTDSPCFDVPG